MKYVFIHSFNKYSLGIYCMSRAMPGTRAVTMGNTKHSLFSHEALTLVGDNHSSEKLWQVLREGVNRVLRLWQNSLRNCCWSPALRQEVI